MKRILLGIFALLLLFVAARLVESQSGTTLPPASTSSITVPFSDLSCTSAQGCGVQIYTLQGACPATLAGSTGWTLAATSALPGAGSVTLTTGIAATTQYAIDVEATPAGSSTVYSGPSNCATITTPWHPAPPVVGTPSAS